MAIAAKQHLGCDEEATTLTAEAACRSNVVVKGADATGAQEQWLLGYKQQLASARAEIVRLCALS